MSKKPVTIYVLLLTYAFLLYGGIRGIGNQLQNNPEMLWAAIPVMLAVTIGIVSLFFRMKWPYIYNIVLLSLVIAFQIPLLVNNIASGNVQPQAFVFMGIIMAAFAALLVFFIRNTRMYFLTRPDKEEPKK